MYVVCCSDTIEMCSNMIFDNKLLYLETLVQYKYSRTEKGNEKCLGLLWPIVLDEWLRHQKAFMITFDFRTLFPQCSCEFLPTLTMMAWKVTSQGVVMWWICPLKHICWCVTRGMRQVVVKAQSNGWFHYNIWFSNFVSGVDVNSCKKNTKTK